MRNFIKAFGTGAVFDPATVHIMTGAFDDAWASLMKSGVAAEKHAETARETLAKHIIAAAKNGERNQRNLTEGALLHLARSGLNKPIRDERP